MAKRKSSTRAKKTPNKAKVVSKPRQAKTGNRRTATKKVVTPKKSVKQTISKTVSEPAAKVVPKIRLKRGGSLGGILASESGARIFKWVCLSILLGTTIFWATLGARLQMDNADQLIDGYLFENWQTFRGASFPGAHTFFIKWPLFVVMALLGNSGAVFTGVTIFVSLLTVGGLAYLLHRIERRPRMIGLLWLALALVLLAVPAQPQPGTLLPLNLAMVTTRNIEYLVFIGALIGNIKARKLESKWFWLSAAALTAIIASDKLFLPLALGAGVFMVLGSWFRKPNNKPATGLRVIVAGIFAYIASAIILRIISISGLTHIDSGGTASPYQLVDSARHFVEACIYAVASMLTNFGANPAYDTFVLKDIPGALFKSLAHVSILAYEANLLIFCSGVFAVYKVIKARASTVASYLTLLLAGASLAALGVFVLTKHYYPADGRYLTIILFGLFIGLATYFRSRLLPARYVGILAVVLILLVPVAVHVSLQQYQASAAALTAQKSLTQDIASELKKQSVQVLIGDYWQITPVKTLRPHNLTIVPADQCLQPVKTLSSTAWSKQLSGSSSAILLSNTPSNKCQLLQVLERFGAPTSRTILDNDTQLLVYKNGLSTKAVKQSNPLRAGGLCAPGTALNIVAHEDDDLLFLSPDVLHDVQNQKCVRTIYLTAGNAGGKSDYWHSRELGSEAAYAKMAGVSNVWQESTILVSGKVISQHTLKQAPNITLVFLRLPDGNFGGEGFESTDYASLQQLLNENVPALSTVDATNTFTRQELLTTLATFMGQGEPTILRTQGYEEDYSDGDHSDHHAAGDFAQLAWQGYAGPARLFRYAGYPDISLPANLTETGISTKAAIFLQYANHDNAVCQTASDCTESNTYGKYLARQYSHEIVR